MTLLCVLPLFLQQVFFIDKETCPASPGKQVVDSALGLPAQLVTLNSVFSQHAIFPLTYVFVESYSSEFSCSFVIFYGVSRQPNETEGA